MRCASLVTRLTEICGRERVDHQEIYGLCCVAAKQNCVPFDPDGWKRLHNRSFFNTSLRCVTKLRIKS